LNLFTVKRFILKEIDANESSPKNSDLLKMDSSTGLNVDNESPLEVQKLLKFGQITQYFRSSPKVDSK
jgi:hypothetical protein